MRALRVTRLRNSRAERTRWRTQLLADNRHVVTFAACSRALHEYYSPGCEGCVDIYAIDVEGLPTAYACKCHMAAPVPGVGAQTQSGALLLKIVHECAQRTGRSTRGGKHHRPLALRKRFDTVELDLHGQMSGGVSNTPLQRDDHRIRHVANKSQRDMPVGWFRPTQTCVRLL